MGRASVKANKSIYQITREKLGLTREKASNLLKVISAERLEKIENDKINIQPEDVLTIAKCYNAPALCNYYCSHQCSIGQKYVPEVEEKELSQIAIETLNALNKINRDKDRLLEIVEDGQITEDEYEDFFLIKKTLDKISLSVDSLQLWVDKAISEGGIKKQ